MKKRRIWDLTVITSGGLVLDFGDQVQDIAEVEIGMTAILEDGSAVPDGEYTMPSGEIWVFAASALTEIKPSSEETTEKMFSNEKILYMRYKGRFLVRAEKSRSPGKPILGI